MATVITSECINCGACEPECPNQAIYQGGVEYELNGVKYPPLATDIFYIVPEKCSECVGFHDREACAAVCPVDCCIPDPDRPETEDVLFARARALHPGREFPADFPSRFRASRPAAPAATPAPATPEAPRPAATSGPAEHTTPSVAAAGPVGAAPAPAPETGPPASEPADRTGAADEAPASRAEAAAPPAPAAAPVPAPTASPRSAPAAAVVQPGDAPSPAVAAAAAAPSAVGGDGAGTSGAAAAAGADAADALRIPALEEWEIPLECPHCHAVFTTPFGHFRSGVVLHCPVCGGAYVVSTSMYAQVSELLRPFHARWVRDVERFCRRQAREREEFEARQRASLEAFSETLRHTALALRPSGAPRPRAGAFG